MKRGDKVDPIKALGFDPGKIIPEFEAAHHPREESAVDEFRDVGEETVAKSSMGLEAERKFYAGEALAALGTPQERLRYWISKRMPGGCRILSKGSACECPLCALDRILASAVSLPALQAELQDVRADKDQAYLERNHVVAALAHLFPSGIRRTNIDGWNPDWHGCVFVDLPSGQISYHYHDSQAHLFVDLPPYLREWDGHDKATVHQRLGLLRPSADLTALRAALQTLHDDMQAKLDELGSANAAFFHRGSKGIETKHWLKRFATLLAVPPASTET